MRRIQIREKKINGDSLQIAGCAQFVEFLAERLEFPCLEWGHDRAAIIHSLGNAKAISSIEEWLGLNPMKVIVKLAVAPLNKWNILEAFTRDVGDACPLPLDESIGTHRCTQNQRFNLPRIDPGQLESVNDCAQRLARDRRDFGLIPL